MHKIGLKLWSTNVDNYQDEIIRLYEGGVFDFIELYVVPGTYDTLDYWQKLYKNIGIPFSIHAPHFNHQVNLADPEKRSYNKAIFHQIFQYADGLQSSQIIFHPGVQGTLSEAIYQIKTIFDERLFVENKPPYQIPSKRLCRGSRIEEIRKILEETHVHFCLDIGHAFCTANFLKIDPYCYLSSFSSLKPTYCHLVDNFDNSDEDRHLNLLQGNYSFRRIFGQIISSSEISILLETQKKDPKPLSDFENDVNILKTILKTNE